MIDHRAEVHPNAKLGANVTIGPWTIIGPDVEIGDNTEIGPHVIIKGPTKIGANNQIFQFNSIGEAPQDKKYQNEDTLLEIGDNNIIREFCTLNRGTVQGGGLTKIGSNNLLMAYVHIAHDCIVGNNTIIANYVGLAGHVIVEDFVGLGGYAGVHQFCTIGAHSYVGNNCAIVKDVLPYTMVAGGDNPSAFGINSVGLSRRNFSATTIENIKTAYKIIFRKNYTVDEALPQLEAMLIECPEIQLMINMLKNSKRGVTR